jgi:2-amino-4-hydroxy-6-hydroxymethyldihydropteridine diphosphokinase
LPEGRHDAAIALGANLGDAAGQVESALQRIAGAPGIELVRSSGLYLSEPWGKTDQPQFVNAAARIATTMSPRSLMDFLLTEEKRAGRERKSRWGPRILDLDLLWFDDVVRSEPGLTLPHPGIAERSFVLLPLAEIAPDWQHPLTRLTPSKMLESLRRSGAWTRCVPLAGGESMAATDEPGKRKP